MLNTVYMKCKNCLKPFEQNSHNQIFCGRACQIDWYNAHVGSGYADQLSRNSRGTLAELAVAVDLLEKHYEVFRAMNPTQDNDLIALKDDKIYIIDAKSGRKNQSTGKIYFPKKTKAPNYAIYVPSEKKIYYYPSPLVGYSI